MILMAAKKVSMCGSKGKAAFPGAAPPFAKKGEKAMPEAKGKKKAPPLVDMKKKK